MMSRTQVSTRGDHQAFEQDALARAIRDPRFLRGVIWMLIVALGSAAVVSFATATPDEFTAAATKFEGWLSGGFGKMAAFLAAGVGAILSAFSKSIFPIALGIGVALLITISIGIINATFTALI